MGTTTNYCLKGPQDQVVGFRLGAEELGHEIYDILDWADEHFSSYFVEQTDEHVYVGSEAARDTLQTDQVRAEPLTIETNEGGGQPGGGPHGGSLGGGPGGGGPGGGGPEGNAPAGSGNGGGAVAESAGL